HDVVELHRSRPAAANAYNACMRLSSLRNFCDKERACGAESNDPDCSGPLLHRQLKVSLQPLQLAVLFWSELIFPKPNHKFVQRAAELERHFGFVIVNNWRSSVLANVETLI